MEYTLEEIKGGTSLGMRDITQKAFYTFGRTPNNGDWRHNVYAIWAMNSTLALGILPPQLRLSKGVAFLIGVATRHLSAGPAGSSRQAQHTSGPQAGHRQCVELFKKERRTMPRFRLSLQGSTRAGSS